MWVCPGLVHSRLTTNSSPCPHFLRKQVQDTLSSGNFLGVINVLMQLRKVWHLLVCVCVCV